MTKFNKLAFGVEISNRSYRLRLSRYHALARTIAEYVQKKNGEEDVFLLDVGVGKGRTKMYLEPQLDKKIYFVGVDNHPGRLESVYQKEDWKLVKTDVEKGLPFPSEIFDIVVCEQILEHLHDTDYVLEEMARVLRPGGLLIVGVPIFPPFLHTLRLHTQPIYDKFRRIERSHIQTFSLSSICGKILEISSLEIAEKKGFRFISGGAIGFLENFRFWWKINERLGRLLPAFTIEAQIIVKKDGCKGKTE